MNAIDLARAKTLPSLIHVNQNVKVACRTGPLSGIRKAEPTNFGFYQLQLQKCIN